MIVKIQLPLMTNGNSEPMALIYNRSRRFQMQIAAKDVLELFEPGELKIYAKVRTVGFRKKKLQILEVLPEQDF